MDAAMRTSMAALLAKMPITGPRARMWEGPASALASGPACASCASLMLRRERLSRRVLKPERVCDGALLLRRVLVPLPEEASTDSLTTPIPSFTYDNSKVVKFAYVLLYL